MALTVEFTIEPFRDGDPGPHVRAALDAARRTGLAVDFGPFGTLVSGDDRDVLAALAPITEAAVGAGATRVSLQVAPAPSR